jgi:hypothetical protein
MISRSTSAWAITLLTGLWFVFCTDLEEQQGELRERRSSTEEGAAAEMRRIRQTDPKLR